VVASEKKVGSHQVTKMGDGNVQPLESGANSRETNVHAALPAAERERAREQERKSHYKNVRGCFNICAE